MQLIARRVREARNTPCLQESRAVVPAPQPRETAPAAWCTCLLGRSCVVQPSPSSAPDSANVHRSTEGCDCCMASNACLCKAPPRPAPRPPGAVLASPKHHKTHYQSTHWITSPFGGTAIHLGTILANKSAHVHTRTYTQAHAHTHMYTHLHTYTHTNPHTCEARSRRLGRRRSRNCVSSRSWVSMGSSPAASRSLSRTSQRLMEPSSSPPNRANPPAPALPKHVKGSNEREESSTQERRRYMPQCLPHL